MLTCIALVNWTDQGVKNVRETLARTEAVDKLVDDFGIKNWRLYWTMGLHDLVSIFDAPDDKSATTFVLAVGSGGNVRTTTMRAYDRDEMSEIIESWVEIPRAPGPGLAASAHLLLAHVHKVRGRGILGSSRLQAGADLGSNAAARSAH